MGVQQIAEVVTGNTPPTSDPKNYGAYVAFVKPPQLIGLPISSAPESLSRLGASKARVLPVGAVLVTCIGNLGRTAISKVICATNQQINALVFDVPVVPEYGFYYSQTLEPWLTSVSSATTVSIVNKGKFETTPFPLAPAAEQTRIVAKLEELLSDLDAGVAELKAAKKKLGQYRQSLLKAAVEGALTADWRAAQHTGPVGKTVKKAPVESGAALLARILTERRSRWETRQLAKFQAQGKPPPKDWQSKYPAPVAPETTGLPALPAGWVWSSLGQCFQVAVGATPSRKASGYWGGGIPWVSSGEVRFNRITESKETISEEGLNNSSTRLNPVGSVLLGMIGEGKTRGQVAILDIEAANNQNCAAIWASETDVPPEYVYFWMWSRYDETRRGSSGNNQPALNKSIVENIPFPLPPLDELQQIVPVLSAALLQTSEQEAAVEYSLKQSAAQRKNILQAAFSGQLVPQDSADEPASALLARIRAERDARETGAARGRGKKMVAA